MLEQLLQEWKELPGPSEGPELCFLFVCVDSLKWDCQVRGKQNIPHHYGTVHLRVISAFHSSSWIFSFTPLGSGDVILCADHPILGQAVIVLHLDYPNCYESQDAFSPGHVKCTSLPHRSDVVWILGTLEFFPYFYKHWNSCPILLNIRIPALSFRTLENSGLILSNVGIPAHPFEHWKSGPILSNIGILALFYKHWNFGPILSNIGIPPLSSFKHWCYGPFLSNIGISALSFQILEFWPYFCKHCYSGTALSLIGIAALSFLTFEFRPHPLKHWYTDPILSNIEVLALSF